jgi:hypothetical protein
MVELLESYRPAPGQLSDPDLRGWEWHYLWRLSHQELGCSRSLPVKTGAIGLGFRC